MKHDLLRRSIAANEGPTGRDFTGTPSMNIERHFIPLNIALLTISDTDREIDDHSGQTLADRLIAAGHRLIDRRSVPDDIYRIRALVSAWIVNSGIQVILSAGGTGLKTRDSTPEAVSALFDKTLHGFGEVFRAMELQEIQTSTIQARAIAGVANGTYIFCLPGSAGACRMAWDHLIMDQLDYRTRPSNLVEFMPNIAIGGDQIHRS